MEDKTNLPSADALIRRGELCLEDKEWEQASSYYQKALDTDPENAKAYIGLVLAANKFSTEEELADSKYGFDSNKCFEKALRFASPEYREKLTGYDTANKLNRANALIESAATPDDYAAAIELLEGVKDQPGVSDIIDDCSQKYEELKEEFFSQETSRLMESSTAENLKRAAEMFEESDPEKYAELIEECRKRSADIEASEIKKRKKKKTIIIASIAATILIPVIVLFSFRIAANVKASKIFDDFCNGDFHGIVDNDGGFYQGYINNTLDNSSEYWHDKSEIGIEFIPGGLAKVTTHEIKDLLAYPSYYYTAPNDVDEMHTDLYDFDISVTLGGDVYLILEDSYRGDTHKYEVFMDDESGMPWCINDFEGEHFTGCCDINNYALFSLKN